MKKRDAAYYRKRLKAEYPAIFADLDAGRISSVRQAAAKAGLIHLPTRLLALRREWKGATNKERREFLEWLRSGSAPGIGKTAKDPLLDADGFLRLEIADRIVRWMASERLKRSEAYVAMGLNAHDSRVIGTIQRTSRPASEVLEAVGAWLAKHAS